MTTPKIGMAVFAYFTPKIHIKMALHRNIQRFMVASNLQFFFIPDFLIVTLNKSSVPSKVLNHFLGQSLEMLLLDTNVIILATAPSVMI